MTASIGTKAIRGGLAALAVALGVAPAHAALLELDLLAPQDGLITLDTRSGLEWLDLNATFGLAYNDTLATDYVTRLGFRFATPDDLLGLFAHVGVSPGESAANGPGVHKLLDLMGCTAQCYQGWRAGQGWLDMGDPTMTAWAFFQYHEMAGEPGGPMIVIAHGGGIAVAQASAKLPSMRSRMAAKAGWPLSRAVPVTERYPAWI